MQRSSGSRIGSKYDAVELPGPRGPEVALAREEGTATLDVPIEAETKPVVPAAVIHGIRAATAAIAAGATRDEAVAALDLAPNTIREWQETLSASVAETVR